MKRYFAKLTGDCSHKRSTPVLRRIFRLSLLNQITSLKILEVHKVRLRIFALFCEKSASQSEHFGLCEQALRNIKRLVDIDVSHMKYMGKRIKPRMSTCMLAER